MHYLVITSNQHVFLTVPLANQGQDAGVGGGACDAGGGQYGGGFCVLEEAGVDLLLSQGGQSRDGHSDLRNKERNIKKIYIW